jgi:NhaP-type Na+/H+ or K+/H+ antiporter
METVGLVAVLLCILVAAALSRRIQNTMLTLPMVYAVLGLLLSNRFLGIIEISPDSEIVRLVAELTLVLLLATDASRIDLRALVRDRSLPQRLLGIGLPLTMVLGTIVAALMFGVLSFWEAAILAIVLTPTDAGLGQAVVTNPKVPVRIRQSLNIESGLNDGIAMPFLLLAIALAIAAETVYGNLESWLLFAAGQIIFGLVVGVVVGYLGVKFLERGVQSGWMSSEFQKISALVLALLAYGLAELVGGNGFIAAFCMGATAGNIGQKASNKILHEYVEIEVQLLMLLTFMIFGAVLLPPVLDQVNGTIILYALISLTLIRMIPVAISLIGTQVKPVTTLFLGWFGPRGVASILYTFTVVDTEGLVGVQLITTVVMITVLFSIFAHGITAAPLAKWYGQKMADKEKVQPGATEKGHVPEMPLRVKPKA